jgi:hypothetical protein
MPYTTDDMELQAWPSCQIRSRAESCYRTKIKATLRKHRKGVNIPAETPTERLEEMARAVSEELAHDIRMFMRTNKQCQKCELSIKCIKMAASGIMQEVDRRLGYVFFIGCTKERGKVTMWYNISPEPKTKEEAANFSAPTSGYANAEYIERIKGVRFSEQFRNVNQKGA